MKVNHLLLGVTALVLGGTVVAPKLVEAYRGDPAVQGPNYSEERHVAMTQAFQNQDYQAWKKLMQGRGRVSEVVTEDNFARFAEAHRLAQEGRLEEARQIRQELGLGLRDGVGRNGADRGRAPRMGNCPNMQ
jgi:hypothetical protein